MAILLVEHDVQLVMQVCAHIYVLDFGAILAVGTPDEIQQNPAVLDAYLGHTRGGRRVIAEAEATAASVPMLELIGLRAAYGRIEVLHGVDLVVPKGSVVALLGPNGGGKTTTLKVASGQVAGDRRLRPRRRPPRQRRAHQTRWPASACARSPRVAACSPTSPCGRTCAWSPTPA